MQAALELEAEVKALEEVEKTSEGQERLIQEERTRLKEEAERQLRHDEWVEKERIAQEEFRQKKEKEEKKLKEREEREKMIKEEWETLEKKEKEASEKREKEKEAMMEEALADIERSIEKNEASAAALDENDWLWHNPLAPPEIGPKIPTELKQKKELEEKNYGTEKDKVNCAFYLKTGACRYGDMCSRHHLIPDASSTLLIRGLYQHILLTQGLNEERGQDVDLELDERDLYDHFTEFYNDVFPEFSNYGEIVQFKVCRNFEPHLRGNVYVQYSTEEECASALQAFNGRWYAGRQLTCELSPVTKWKPAICGMFFNKSCPKGRNCNFLHVFNNPGNAFAWADSDRRQGDESSERQQTNMHTRLNFGSNRRHDSAPRTSRRPPPLPYPLKRHSSHGSRRRSRSRSPQRRNRRHRSRSSSLERRRRRRKEGKRRRRSSSYSGDSSSGTSGRSSRSSSSRSPSSDRRYSSDDSEDERRRHKKKRRKSTKHKSHHHHHRHHKKSRHK